MNPVLPPSPVTPSLASLSKTAGTAPAELVSTDHFATLLALHAPGNGPVAPVIADTFCACPDEVPAAGEAGLPAFAMPVTPDASVPAAGKVAIGGNTLPVVAGKERPMKERSMVALAGLPTAQAKESAPASRPEEGQGQPTLVVPSLVSLVTELSGNAIVHLPAARPLPEQGSAYTLVAEGRQLQLAGASLRPTEGSLAQPTRPAAILGVVLQQPGQQGASEAPGRDQVVASQLARPVEVLSITIAPARTLAAWQGAQTEASGIASSVSQPAGQALPQAGLQALPDTAAHGLPQRTTQPSAIIPRSAVPENDRHTALTPADTASEEADQTSLRHPPALTQAQGELPRAALGEAPLSTSGRTAQAAPPAHDFAAVIDRLAEARELARPHSATLNLAHREFGAVTVQFELAGQALKVALSSSDAGFAPAVQAALADAAPATRSEQAGSGLGSTSGGQTLAQGQADGQRPDQQARTALLRQPATPEDRNSEGDRSAGQSYRTRRDSSLFA